MEAEYTSQNPRTEADEHMILRDQLQPVISLNNVQMERKSNEDNLICADSSSSSSSSTSPDAPEFSFSSDSSSDEFIQVDHPILIIPKPSTEKHEEEEEEDESVVSNLSQLKLEEFLLRSSSTNSRISDVTIESYIPDVSPTQSPPPLQVMEKTSTDFDPERIPSSIFGKPASPLDWSVASNESLFSIHIGNYSFAHDRVDSTEDCYSFREMYKSGELMNSNNVSEAKNDTQNIVSCKAKILDEALVNTPTKSMNIDEFKIKQGGFEDKRDNCRGTEVKVQSYPHPIKGSRYCCCSKPECCCEGLTCQSCSCNNRLLFLCWPNCCCSPSSCVNCKCLKWWNLCNCFSSCSSSCWTCSFRKIFCCFSYQRSRNLQSNNKASKQATTNNYCRCCFSCPCCCS